MSVVSALDIHRAVSESREKGGRLVVVISQSQIVRSCSSMALDTSKSCFMGNYYDIWAPQDFFLGFIMDFGLIKNNVFVYVGPFKPLQNKISSITHRVSPLL